MGELVFLGLGALGILGVIGAISFFIDAWKAGNSGHVFQVLFIASGLGALLVFIVHPQLVGLALSIGVLWAVVTGRLFK